VTGAAAIPVDLVERMRKELGFKTVLTGYGLTEATGVSTLCRREDDAETIATTSGRAIPGVDIRVIGDDGIEVPRGTPGEVVVSGYTVTGGYLDDDVETSSAIDSSGRLRTGDVGVMDSRGYLRITDRKKDMFIVGGFNAYPAEIESVLSRHDAIARVAVIGTPDNRLGEVGVAFVVLRPGARTDESSLVDWSRERMANYKVPRRFVFVSELPSNATGKVLKHTLREHARQASRR
jgi:acyl-CoA synthetase (AMP-forming)/AMP-acid ligase II